MKVVKLSRRTEEALAAVFFFVESGRNRDVCLFWDFALGVLYLHLDAPL